MSKFVHFNIFDKVFFMKPFLYSVAQDIINKYDIPDNFCIIFPNKRTSTFFKKYYAEIIKKSSWSPNIFTIDNFIKKISGISTLEKNQLLIELYLVAKDVFNKTKENQFFNYFTFDKFFSIGEIILNDFNDIDNYLLEAKDIFRNIKDIEEIDLYYNYLSEYHKEILREFWLNFSIEKRSEEKQKFLALWENLPEIYNTFTKKLIDRKKTYGGLRNRYTANLIKQHKISTEDFSSYIFVGFNAMNKAEKQIFKYFKQQNKAIFYWDFDNYYINDIKQEAGFFMRENLENYPEQLTEIKDFINNTNKNVQLIGVPLQIGQAKAISKILCELKNNDENYYNKTAIILADEHFLFPVLHSLPNNIPSVNITMGYPLKETTIYSLIIDYIQIQNNAFSFKEANNQFYYKDVKKILLHPEIQPITKNISTQIIKEIDEKNKIFLNYDFFNNFKIKVFELIFFPVSKSENPVNLLLTNILNILYIIFNKPTKNNVKKIENEYIYQVYIEIKKLRDLIETNSKKVDFSFNISIKLLKKILSSIRIPFSGEHSEGLQIMGLMETRNLDFENIIMLGVNEGILPDTGRKPSFISDNLRIAFDLPVLKFQDSIFAYFFYRILQKAQNIRLLYNTIIGNNNGEISRFIQQLKFETKLKIVEKQFKQELKPSLTNSIIIKKDEKILQTLASYISNENLQSKHFTASSLNTYIDCPLKFYFRYIAGLKPKKEIEEEITPATFGNILHFAIEKLYLDFTNKKNNKLIEFHDIELLINNLELYIEKAFKNYYQIPENQKFNFEGTNIIVKEVVYEHLKNILKIDSLYAPFQIVDLEQEKGYIVDIETVVNSKPKNVSLWGIFDRIDFKNNIYRIIDYKTGSVEKSFSSVEELFNPKKNNRQTAIFQLFYYSYILKSKDKNFRKNFYPGIYNIREMVKTSFSPEIIYKPDKNKKLDLDCLLLDELLNEFESYLSELISNIFDTSIDFTQTVNNNNCNYCDFKIICNT